MGRVRKINGKAQIQPEKEVGSEQQLATKRHKTISHTIWRDDRAKEDYKEIYGKSVLSEPPIYIEKCRKKFPDVLEEIEQRQLSVLLAGFGRANTSWVCELLANWRIDIDNVVNVRGKIDLSPDKLNEFLELPRVDRAALQAIEDAPDIDDIRRVIYDDNPKAKWKASAGSTHNTLAFKYFSKKARVYLRLVCLRLIPYEHMT